MQQRKSRPVPITVLEENIFLWYSDGKEGMLVYVVCVDEGEDVYLFRYKTRELLEMVKNPIMARVMLNAASPHTEIQRMVGVFPNPFAGDEEKSRILAFIAETGFVGRAADFLFTRDGLRMIVERHAESDTDEPLSVLVNDIISFASRAIAVMTAYEKKIDFYNMDEFGSAASEYEELGTSKIFYLAPVDRWFGYDSKTFFSPTRKELAEHIQSLLGYYRASRSVPRPADPELRQTVLDSLRRRADQSQRIQQFEHGNTAYIGLRSTQDNYYRRLPSLLSLLSEVVVRRSVLSQECVYFIYPFTANVVLIVVAHAGDDRAVLYIPAERRFMIQPQPLYVLNRPIQPSVVREWNGRVGWSTADPGVLEWIIQTLHGDADVRTEPILGGTAYVADRPLRLEAEAQELRRNLSAVTTDLRPFVDDYPMFFGETNILYCAPLRGLVGRGLQRVSKDEIQRFIENIHLLENGLVYECTDVNDWRKRLLREFLKKRPGSRRLVITPAPDGRVLVSVLDPKMPQTETETNKAAVDALVRSIRREQDRARPTTTTTTEASSEAARLDLLRLLQQQQQKNVPTKKKKKKKSPAVKKQLPASSQSQKQQAQIRAQQAARPLRQQAQQIRARQAVVVAEARPLRQQQQQAQQIRARQAAQPPRLPEGIVSRQFRGDFKRFQAVLNEAGEKLVQLFPTLGNEPHLTTVVALLTVLNPIVRKERGAIFVLKGGRAACYHLRDSSCEDRRIETHDFDFRFCCSYPLEPAERLAIVGETLRFIQGYMRSRRAGESVTIEIKMPELGRLTPTTACSLDLNGRRAIDIIGLLDGAPCDTKAEPLASGNAAILFVVSKKELVTDWMRGFCHYHGHRQLLKIAANRKFCEKTVQRLRTLFPGLVGLDEKHFLETHFGGIIGQDCLEIITKHVFYKDQN
ncbi:hypothetical protein EBZ80_02280 [bacterium]|nr:hypothetical protein [bacterium]